MPLVIVDAEYRLDVDRLYAAWQRMLQPGLLAYQMPTIGAAPDGRLSYPDMPTTFLAILTQNAIPYEEQQSG